MQAKLSRLFCALALSAGAIGLVHADPFDPTMVILNPVGDTMNQTGSFANSFTTAGAFSDDYVFAGAPAADLGLLQFLASAGSNLSFTSVSLSYAFGGDTITLDSASLTPSAINAFMSNADSSLFDLQISGIALAPGASYGGSINETFGGASPVPEPSSYAMLLAGSSLLMWLQRRRKLMA